MKEQEQGYIGEPQYPFGEPKGPPQSRTITGYTPGTNTATVTLDGCDICGGAHTNEDHLTNCDSEGRYC